VVTPVMASGLEPQILRACGASHVRLERRFASLWGGYGELWRAEVTLATGAAHAVVKHVRPPPGPGDLAHRRKLRSYEVELAFYRHYAERCLEAPGCRVPRSLGLISEQGAWLFVLEDLAQSGFGRARARPGVADVASTLRWLAGFHARFLGTRPDGLWATGTYWHLTTRPEELASMTDVELGRAAPDIDRRLEAARFKTLVHGDAKLENVCFAREGGDVALVDFQYVGGGVGVKDVAYLLNGSLSPREHAERVPFYLDLYFQELARALAESGRARDFHELEREWRALFPLAWVDYYRFLLGWTKGRLASEPYSELLAKRVLAELKSG